MTVEWTPPNADLVWDLDLDHMPAALPPLSGDYLLQVCAGFNRGMAFLGAPIRFEWRVVNGWFYGASRTVEPPARTAPPVEEMGRWWEDDALPRIRSTHTWVRSLDIDGLAPDAAADAFSQAWDRVADTWSLHFGGSGGVGRLRDLLSEHGFEPDDALTIAQGHTTTLEVLDRDLDALVAAAGEADRFAAALQNFLDVHGHLGQTCDDFSLPPWRDDPGPLLAEVDKRVSMTAEAAHARWSRVRAEGDALLRVVRERLDGRPDEQLRLDETVAAARSTYAFSQDHNYWLDRMDEAEMRSLSMRAGRRLAAARAFALPDDVFFLHAGEVVDAVRTPRDLSDLVAQRRVDHERFATLTPPRRLGAVQETAPTVPATNVLGGTGVGKGTVRGVARVVLGRADFYKLGAREVLVCRDTNPSWLPLFTVAGAIVAEGGGAMSHTAVVAREVGLPGVVAVAGVLGAVRDGETIEVDATAGEVRLL